MYQAKKLKKFNLKSSKKQDELIVDREVGAAPNEKISGVLIA